MHHDRLGLSFDYPDNWTIDTDTSDRDAPAVTVYSPEGAFWSLSAHEAGTDPESLSRAIVDEMRSEYRDLDTEAAVDRIGDRSLTGFDLNFYCLDLTNTAQVRSLATPDATYVVFCQAEDREWDRIAHVFAAMTASFMRSLPPVAEDDEDD